MTLSYVLLIRNNPKINQLCVDVQSNIRRRPRIGFRDEEIEEGISRTTIAGAAELTAGGGRDEDEGRWQRSADDRQM
jgi:hypothetical protein